MPTKICINNCKITILRVQEITKVYILKTSLMTKTMAGSWGMIGMLATNQMTATRVLFSRGEPKIKTSFQILIGSCFEVKESWKVQLRISTAQNLTMCNPIKTLKGKRWRTMIRLMKSRSLMKCQ